MHKKKIDKDPGLTDMMTYLKRDLNRAVTIKDFTQWASKHTSVLSPLRMLQTHLRFQVIGPNFWSRMTEQRRGHPEMGKIDYLPRLQERVIRETKYFLTRGGELTEEMQRLRRRGRGPEGDTRDNIVRKQSLLVKYFALSRYSLRHPGPGPMQVAPEPSKSKKDSADSSKQPQVSSSAKAESPGPEIEVKPRRRRSSYMIRRPALVIKAEMPQGVQKKPSGAIKKK